MPIFIRLPLALDLLLIAIEHLVPAASGFLPLGQDQFTQLGILICLGIVAQELNACHRKAPGPSESAPPESPGGPQS